MYREVRAARPRIRRRCSPSASARSPSTTSGTKTRRYVIQILKRLSRARAGGDWAFERLSLLLTIAERWDELLAEYDRKLAHDRSSAERRLPLLEEAARIAKDFAGQGERASDYLKELLLSTPAQRSARGGARAAPGAPEPPSGFDRHLGRPPEQPVPARTLWRRAYTSPIGSSTSWGTRSLRCRWPRRSWPARGGETEACRLLEQIAVRESAAVDAAPARARDPARALRARRARRRRDPHPRAVAARSRQATTQRRELHEACAAWLIESERYDEALAHSAALLCARAGVDRGARRSCAAWPSAPGGRIAYAGGAGRGRRGLPARRAAHRDPGRGRQGLRAQGRSDPSAPPTLYMGVLDDARASDAPRLFVARRLRQLLRRGRRQAAPARRAGAPGHARAQPRAGSATCWAKPRKLADRARRHRSLARALAALPRGERGRPRRARRAHRDPGARRALGGADRRPAAPRAARRRRPGARRSDLGARRAHLRDASLFRLENAIDVWRDIEQQFGSNAQTVDALVDLCAAADALERRDRAAHGGGRDGDRSRGAARISWRGSATCIASTRKTPARAIDYYRQALELNALHEAARSGLRALLGSEAARARRRRDAGGGAHRAPTSGPACSSSSSCACEPARSRHGVRHPARGRRHPGAARAGSERRAHLPVPRFRARPERRAGERAAAAGADQRRMGHRGHGLPARDRSLERRRSASASCASRAARSSKSASKTARPRSPATGRSSRATRRTARPRARWRAWRPGSRAWNELGWVFVANSIALGQRRSQGRRRRGDGDGRPRRAWEHTTQAIFERIDATRELAPKVAHDLRRELAVWYRDQRGDRTTAETLLSLAVESERDPDTLRMLAELRRASSRAARWCRRCFRSPT